MEQEDAVFTARAQIDAIALCPQSQTKNRSPLLAVAISSLEGNQWNGGLAIVDALTGQRRLGLELPTGVSSLVWCGPEQDLLACACDNGDIELLQLISVDGEDPSLQPVQQANPDGVAVGLWGHDDVVTSVSASIFEKNIIASSSWDLSYVQLCINHCIARINLLGFAALASNSGTFLRWIRHWQRSLVCVPSFVDHLSGSKCFDILYRPYRSHLERGHESHAGACASHGVTGRDCRSLGRSEDQHSHADHEHSLASAFHSLASVPRHDLLGRIRRRIGRDVRHAIAHQAARGTGNTFEH